jgi:superfamily I DNA/RNA helicase
MAITLDATQRVAATGSGRFQLVLAGPGSGKTTTLTAHSGADLHPESR